MTQEARYNLLKWNGKFGDSSIFVVLDNSNQKQSFFTPDKLSDLTWVDHDLTVAEETKGWDDFGREPIKNLEDVVF
jgi:hypothetical protein